MEDVKTGISITDLGLNDFRMDLVNYVNATDPVLPLPVALDIKALYEQMLFAFIDLPPRPGETLQALVERIGLIRKHIRDLQALKAKMHKERQFNRKMELNTQMRAIQTRLQGLQQVDIS